MCQILADSLCCLLQSFPGAHVLGQPNGGLLPLDGLTRFEADISRYVSFSELHKDVQAL